VNRDGKLDILVNGNGSAYPTNLYLLTGNGDGTFKPGLQAIPTTTPSGQGLPAPSSFSVADLRGNGILDIVTSGGGLYVWPGNGDGTFGQPVRSYSVGDEGAHFVFGDFNGDGKTDVAMCGPNDMILISLGNGDDTFGSQAMYNIPRTDNNGTCNAIVAGDFNGDGSLDVAGLNSFTGSNGLLTLLLSNPVLAFSNSRLAFQNTNVGSSSGSTVLSVTNQSYTPLSFAGVSIAGADPNDFAESNNCGTSLPAGGSCNVSVTFTPMAPGVRTATVSLNDSSAGSPQQIAVSGTGLQSGPLNVTGSVSFSSSALTYNRLSKTGTETITVTNTSSNTLAGPIELVLSISNASVTATNASGTYQGKPYWTSAGSLAPGASATFTITFSYPLGTTFTTTPSLYSGAL
jgi:hypothetical protein